MEVNKWQVAGVWLAVAILSFLAGVVYEFEMDYRQLVRPPAALGAEERFRLYLPLVVNARQQ